MPKQKLLVRLPNWVGDVIMTLPALELLKKHDIEPILIGRPRILQLLEGCDYQCISSGTSFAESVKQLNKQSCKDILLFPNSLSSALIARLASKFSFGYQGDGRSLLLNCGLKKPAIRHESKIFYQLAQHVIEISQQKIITPIHHAPKLPISKSAMLEAESILRQYQIDQPFMVLCPFAKGLNQQKKPKRWPLWSELSNQLSAHTHLICPGPDEVEEAKTAFPHAIILEQIPLNTYAAILSMANLVISNDSGPLHIASAVGCQTIGLFGATDPERSAPENCKVLGNATAWPSMEEVLEQVRLK
jgi:heptosyltransferase-2